MIERLFLVLTLAKCCCINTTHASGENLSPDTSPDKKVNRTELRRPVYSLTSEQRTVLKDAGFSEQRLILIEFAQAAFYRVANGSSLKATSYFDASELQKVSRDLKEFGASDPDVTIDQIIFSLKSLYPDPVPLSNLARDSNIIHTPSVRFAFSSEKEARDAIESIVDKTLLQHVTGLTFKEPDEANETPDERTARRNMQAKTFKIMEAKRGITQERLVAESNQTHKAWEQYFAYIELRKQAIDNGLAVKITPHEIEDIFHKFVQPSYAYIDVNGWRLYFNRNEIDLSRCNHKSESNFDLLMKNDSPIGADGQPMNLHHLTRRQPGIIVLLPGSFHTQHTGLLHLRSEQHMRQPEAINRHQFDWWKELALKALGEYLRPSSATTEASISTTRGKTDKGIRHIRPREAAPPVRTQVATKLFYD